MIILNLLFFNSYAQLNSADSDKSFNISNFNNLIVDVEEQTDGKLIVGGSFTYYKSIPLGQIARLNIDGTLDQSFNTGLGFTNGTIKKMKILSDGKILVSGTFYYFNGIQRVRILRLNTDGTLDMTFDPGIGPDAEVSSFDIQSDGKIIIAGRFVNVNNILNRRIARLNTDGTLDNTFNVGTGSFNDIKDVKVQADDKIIIGGQFSTINGVARGRIARLNSDGSIDNSFITASGGFNNTVNSIAIQTDGKILVGGYFTTYDAINSNYLARLNNDGSIDNLFNIGTGASGVVLNVKIQNNSQILIVGQFLNFNGNLTNKLARLNNNGTYDNTFNTGGPFNSDIYEIECLSNNSYCIVGLFTQYNSLSKPYLALLSNNGIVISNINPAIGPNDQVYDSAILPDGKIIIVGNFTAYDNYFVNRVARINKDGTLDLTFNIGTGANSLVRSVVIQSDGKIIIGGAFSAFNGISSKSIIRLNQDGSIDNSYNTGTGFNSVFGIFALALQNDGKLLFGGAAGNYNGNNADYISRLNIDGTYDNSFSKGYTNGLVHTINVQLNGRIIIGGRFTYYDGVIKNRVARLYKNGSIDNTFNIGTAANNYVYASEIQNDGKILLGGKFTMFNGVSKYGLVRLNQDGSIDNSFNIGTGINTTFDTIRVIQLYRTSNILISGQFTTFNGATKYNFARLNMDGTFNSTFNQNVLQGSNIRSILIQENGEIILGGQFTRYNDIPFNFLLKLKGDLYTNIIRGKTFSDVNGNCSYNQTENRIKDVLIKAIPGPYYSVSNQNGEFSLLVDSGTYSYTVSQEFNEIQSKNLLNKCNSSYNIDLTGYSKDTCCVDFPDSIKQCSLLKIDIYNTRMIRCFKNKTYVNYCNEGNEIATNAQIKIEYPQYIIPVNSTPMWTSKTSSTLIYDISSVSAGECNTIIITDSVSCEDQSILGLTQCLQASISPKSNCLNDNPSWDKSSIKVSGKCENDSIRFTILNDGTGDMEAALEYRIFENDTLIYKNTFLLNSKSQFIVSVLANGNTFRLEADQHSLHPGKSRPRVAIENCNFPTSSTVVKGLVTTAPINNLDEFIGYSCNTIRGSYDPNDKIAIPKGIGINNQVGPSEMLDYTIRYQNTGTDTAYYVVIIDTIDINLKPESLIQGISSHPYKFEVTGKGQPVLIFKFNNINLPDSTTDKVNSNGLVSFKIKILDNIPLGTVIKNKAYIYFDYNAPVLTNETFHTVGITIYEDLVKGSKVQIGNILSGKNSNYKDVFAKVYPNPNSGSFTFEQSINYNNKSEMKIYSNLGVLIKKITLKKDLIQHINVNDCKSGNYIYEILQDDIPILKGILQVIP